MYQREEGVPHTWQNSTWWEFGGLDAILEYLSHRYVFNETPEEGVVEVVLEIEEMPHDLLVQLVVHAAVEKSKIMPVPPGVARLVGSNEDADV